jgi:hypothetical protein
MMEESVRRAEGEDGVLEKGVELIPNLCEIIRLELALQMAEVLLDAALGEDEGGLEGEGREAGDDINLLLNLFGEKVETEGTRANSSAEEVDPIVADGIERVDCGLVDIEGKRGADGSEERGGALDGEGVIGEDNVIQIGKDERRGGGGRGDGGEVILEPGEGFPNGEGKEERSKRISLTDTRGRQNRMDPLIPHEHHMRGLVIRPLGRTKKKRAMLLDHSGRMHPRSRVEGIGEV